MVLVVPIRAKNLRRHFEVNSHYVVLATLKTLADEGTIPASKVSHAIKKYKIDTKKTKSNYSLIFYRLRKTTKD